MGTKLLGEHFDIHGGGQDLQFPHHENEIAQSEGATGQTFVNYWMHNGFVRVDDEKMSKSLGNFFAIRDVLKRYDAEVVRFFVARAHYRSPLNYSDQHLDDARSALGRLYTALKDAPAQTAEPDWNDVYGRRFRQAMDDDFNTPEAVAVLFDLANEINRTHAPALIRQLRALGGLLGLLQRDAMAFHQALPAQLQGGQEVASDALSPQFIEQLIAERAAAKQAKNYAEADRIRKGLLDAGIVLEDTAKGTSWRRA
jgi:cysteinyl-tRNA synthetase